MAGSSNINPEKVIIVKVKPVLKLKESISSLSDLDFNPNSRARINITKQGFELTARNTETGVIANLSFKPGTIRLECRKEIVGKWINVAEFHQKLEEGTKRDGDLVTFSHLEGSNQMTFFFGYYADKEHTIELKEMDDEQEEIKRVPDNVFFICHQANFQTKYLRKMMKHLQDSDDPTQEVSVKIEDGLVVCRIGEKTWHYIYDEHEMFPGAKKVHQLERHIGWFRMHHFEAITKALSAAEPIFVWCFFQDLNEEPLMKEGEYIRTTFFLDRVSTLAFIFKPTILLRLMR